MVVWLTALGLALAGLALLGIPGALLLDVYLLVAGPAARDRLPPDSVWPIALYLSLLAPLGLPLAWYATRGVARRGRRVLGGAAAWLAFGLLLAAMFYRMAV